MEILKQAAIGALLGAISGTVYFVTLRTVIKVADVAPIKGAAK